ncbi:MAG: hypothetical protein SGPRY_012348 [Prymnesium sp.]
MHPYQVGKSVQSAKAASQAAAQSTAKQSDVADAHKPPPTARMPAPPAHTNNTVGRVACSDVNSAEVPSGLELEPKPLSALPPSARASMSAPFSDKDPARDLVGWRKRSSAQSERTDLDDVPVAAEVSLPVFDVQVMSKNATARGSGKRFQRKNTAKKYPTVCIEMERAAGGRDFVDDDGDTRNAEMEDTDMLFEEAISKTRKRSR